MIADITLNTIAFVKSYDNDVGGFFRSTTRGVNTADLMTFKGQSSVNSTTKIAEKRYNARIDRENIDAVTGQKYVTSAYFVIVVPVLAVAGDISNVVATFRALVASTTPNIITQMLNDER